MIDPVRFVEHLGGLGISFYTGVPDSLLKSLCSHIMSALPPGQHIIAANEGAAVGIAIGHYLRTADPAVVYLQNSGFGNAVNPLLSLADPDVYGIPMLLLVGWRGRVGVKDEPQHVKQGRVMDRLLDALEVPWALLPKESTAAKSCATRAVQIARAESTPFVIMVEKDTFGSAPEHPAAAQGPELSSREEALGALIDAIGDDGITVSTTGMLSRELFEYRQRRPAAAERDFLTVGGMGHSSSIALGIALREPEREVWCLDGDGALLMHLGSLAVIADHAPANYFHVIFNNGVHDSVGGQPTSIAAVDIPTAAEALGYRLATATSEPSALCGHVALLRERGGPALLELKVRPGNRPGIGRPTRTPRESKRALMTTFGIEADR